jgi:hypothetical protein
MMRNINVFLFFTCISLCAFAQDDKNYTVYWSIGSMRNDSLTDLSFKILDAISKNKIQALDKNGNAMSKNQIEKSIPEELLKSNLTKEESNLKLQIR